MTPHSPTPWRDTSGEKFPDLGGIKDANGDTVAQAQQVPGDALHHKRRANTQAIVRAVNSHAELTGALADCLLVIGGYSMSKAALVKAAERGLAALRAAGVDFDNYHKRDKST